MLSTTSPVTAPPKISVILAAGQPSSCRPTTDRGCKRPFKEPPLTAESGGATRAALLAMRAHRGTGSSNPLPSSDESATNGVLALRLRRDADRRGGKRDPGVGHARRQFAPARGAGGRIRVSATGQCARHSSRSGAPRSDRRSCGAVCTRPAPLPAPWRARPGAAVRAPARPSKSTDFRCSLRPGEPRLWPTASAGPC
jgi:hypothetical protein